MQRDPALSGLTAAEARRRLLADGPNTLPAARRRGLLRVTADVLKEPMLALLAVGGIAYLLLGSRTEAAALICFAGLSILITVAQETRTERALEALRTLAAPSALVVRDETPVRVASAEVARGDVLVLEAGDRVAADGDLLQAHELEIDESLLTGESLPVAKQVGRAIQPDGARAFAGTLVAKGRALARVTATGVATRMGVIGRSLETLETEAPALRRQTAGVVRLAALAGGIISAGVVLASGLSGRGWLQGLLGGIALAMALMPEEFGVVLLVFLAMGAWRLGKAGVLTRRAAAIETLGAATLLCTDKTGTLTWNRMRVTELWVLGGEAVPLATGEALVEPYRGLIVDAALASAAAPSDPMEVAIHGAAPDRLRGTPDRVYPLRPELPAMGQLWPVADGGWRLVVKGAPETVIKLCRPSTAEEAAIARAIETFAAKGARVLAVGCGTGSGRPPASLDEQPLTFTGLVALADPLREDARDAIRAIQGAGVRIAMITGDHVATARAIAAEAGIAQGLVVTGDRLDACGPDELATLVRGASVFARVRPDHKLRLVQALKGAGEVVAMIGDGVNDAPALKAANIGIAMGRRGSDVAREAAAIVLLDDRLATVPEAIRLGRRIYDNIRKAMTFVIAVHVPIAGMALLPIAFGRPLVLEPLHIAFLELIIDPVCALAFEAEPEEPDVMQRLPRAANARLLAPAMLGWGVVQGVLTLALAAASWGVGLRLGWTADATRTLVLITLACAFAALVIADRSFGSSVRKAVARPNRPLLLIYAAVLVMLAAMLAVPPLRSALDLRLFPVGWFLYPVGAAALLLVGLEGMKRMAGAGADGFGRHAPRSVDNRNAPGGARGEAPPAQTRQGHPE